MAVSVSVQYNGGLLLDIILLTQCYYHRGTRFKCHEEVLYLQPMIPPKRFDIFPLAGECSEGLGGIKSCKYKTSFMAFKRVPRCK